MLTKRAHQRGATIALFCGFVMDLYVWLFTKIPWTWYVLIGSVITFAIGYAASLFTAEGDSVLESDS